MSELDDQDVGPPIDGVDHARIERAVREILWAVGENPDREGLLQTPAPHRPHVCRTLFGIA